MHPIAAGLAARLTKFAPVALALLCAFGPLDAQQAATTSQELRELYEADQADRRFSTPPTPEQWAEISERDGARRDRVRQLIRADRLVTADDRYHAAMILQHGEGSEDILLAHILATAAGFEGHDHARWLSAAALDRYLHRTRQPQRFGTQYVRTKPDDPYRLDPDSPWSQGPYETWLPDSIREVFDVEPLAEQEANVDRMNGPSSGAPPRMR